MKKLLTYSILALSIGATDPKGTLLPLWDTQNNGNVTLSYTVGQPVSGVVGQSSKLSQGFQQNTVACQNARAWEGLGNGLS